MHVTEYIRNETPSSIHFSDFFFTELLIHLQILLRDLDLNSTGGLGLLLSQAFLYWQPL